MNNTPQYTLLFHKSDVATFKMQPTLSDIIYNNKADAVRYMDKFNDKSLFVKAELIEIPITWKIKNGWR